MQLSKLDEASQLFMKASWIMASCKDQIIGAVKLPHSFVNLWVAVLTHFISLCHGTVTPDFFLTTCEDGLDTVMSDLVDSMAINTDLNEK